MTRAPILILLVLLTVTAAALAESPEAVVGDFLRAYLGGDDHAGRDRMTPEMAEAMPPDAAADLRARWLARMGDLREVGEPWLEDVVQGHRRYRVPVVFADAEIDLRVVLDGEDRIAGLFQLPHVPTPDERAAAAAKDDASAASAAGPWEGAIELPTGPLAVKVDLVRRDGWWDGTVDIPAQGALGLPLADIRVAADSVSFAIADVPGEPRFAGRLADGEIAGDFTQGGMRFPFRLGRETSPPVARPQDPVPPFPYLEEEVSFANGDAVLAGTLTYPNAPGPFAAALLISGSGPQDRNEEVFDHRPFLVLADHLTRRGLAVLRYDDRGVGASTGDRASATSEDYRDDALAGIRFLAAHPRIDPARIGMIGHSEGGIIAPMAAVACDSVAYVVMLAGTGVPGHEILRLQTELMSRAEGTAEADLETILAAQDRLLDLVLSGADDAALKEQIRASTRAMSGPEADDAMVESQVQAEFARITLPWTRFFLEFDPRPVIARVEAPVLALCGEKDLQVDPAQNLPEIDRALGEGGNPDYTVWEMPGLNHLFQTAGTGALSEYHAIEETFAPAALETVSDWILARFGD